MHKAVSHRMLSATGDNLPRGTLVGPGAWSPELGTSPYVYDPTKMVSRPPITAHSKPDASWGSYEYACRFHARTGAYPMGNAFTPVSATRFDDRPMSMASSSDGSDNDMDEDEDEVEVEVDERQTRQTRVNYAFEQESYDRDERYQQRTHEDSEDDAESCDESESSFEQDDRPRAAISDIRNRDPQDSNTRVRGYSPRRSREAPRTMCNENIARKLPPTVRIVRASTSIVSSRTSEAESSQYEDEYTPSTGRASTSRTSASQDKRASYYRPPRPSAKPSLKRKRSSDVSDYEDTSPPPSPNKAPHIARGATAGQQTENNNRRRKYKCELCPNFYAGSKGDLKRHSESLVHKPPSYVCEMPPCAKKFTRLDALKRHMKNAHAPGKMAPKTFKNGHPKGTKATGGN